MFISQVYSSVRLTGRCMEEHLVLSVIALRIMRMLLIVK